ncbi:MAG: AmmeMemoRadiSam system protein A [bacterium]|nr:AmmeMemoRadiSam system protein A [bacterium]
MKIKNVSLNLVCSLMILGIILGLSTPACSREKKISPPTSTPGGQETFTPAEQDLLLQLARETLVNHVTGKPLPEAKAEQLTPHLKEIRACFVTFNRVDTGLRGCMGYIVPELPLHKCVIDRAVAAASQDPRFYPIRPEELDQIELEVSVLSVPRKLAYNGAQDLLKKLRPGVDGVVLKTRYGGSTFLPQVWEQLPVPEEFLGHLCRKHGAPAECWREDGIEVLTYQASVFKEKRPSPAHP